MLIQQAGEKEGFIKLGKWRGIEGEKLKGRIYSNGDSWQQ